MATKVPTSLTRDFIARLGAHRDGAASLPWKQETPNTYVLKGNAGVIRLLNEGNDEHPYGLQILGPDGTVIEEAITVPDEIYLPWERQLESLYADARTAALNIPQVLEDLAFEFNLPSEPPPQPSAAGDDDIPF
jgi:hypothetical protein